MRIEFKISISLNGMLSYNLVIENYAFHRVKKNFPIHQIFSIYMQKTNWTRKWISHFIFLKWKSLGMENKSTSAIKLKKKSNYQKKIFGRLVGISYTFNTNTKFLSNFPYISIYDRIFIIWSVRIDCFMRTKVHFQPMLFDGFTS